MLFPERLPKDNTDSAKRKAMEDEMTNMLDGNPEKNEKIRPSSKSPPKDKAQTIQQYGFTGPGFPGQHVQSSLKIQFQVIDDQ